jgi:hypothetical protein
MIQALDIISKHDGKLLLFIDSFFVKCEDDMEYLHNTILLNDPLDIPIINIQSSPASQTIFTATEPASQIVAKY